MTRPALRTAAQDYIAALGTKRLAAAAAALCLIAVNGLEVDRVIQEVWTEYAEDGAAVPTLAECYAPILSAILA